jgi:hypothetical protein
MTMVAHPLQAITSMARKLFIVRAGNERLYRSLRSALANEPDVEVFYDRRHGSSSVPWPGEDRRARSDADERIRTDGFAVVRPDAPASRERNIRWA